MAFVQNGGTNAGEVIPTDKNTRKLTAVHCGLRLMMVVTCKAFAILLTKMAKHWLVHIFK